MSTAPILGTSAITSPAGGKISRGINFPDFQVMFFWVMTLCRDVVGYQHFRGPCYLLHFTLKMEGPWPSKILVFYHIITLSHNPEDHSLNFHCHENLKSHFQILLFPCTNKVFKVWDALPQSSLLHLKDMAQGQFYFVLYQVTYIYTGLCRDRAETC
jgi:hypothetical protein